jgi:hypothetical protein
MLTAAKTIFGTRAPESPFRARHQKCSRWLFAIDGSPARTEIAMTRMLVLALLFATLANTLCLVGRF